MQAKNHRIDRINAELRRELPQAAAKIMAGYPNISFVSFTAVEVTRDLSFAKVFVTHILGEEKEHEKLIQDLNAKAAQFRRHLAAAVNLRKMPEISFHYDTSIDYGRKMDSLLRDIAAKRPEKNPDIPDNSEENDA
ncbi:MAG: 30S ribosome-binding factor RbfA [Cardiobacteriaceae bacterium]|nr:30S ribosome-binding factor RbfA [Cardiobacteriaceae bacterium]